MDADGRRKSVQRKQSGLCAASLIEVIMDPYLGWSLNRNHRKRGIDIDVCKCISLYPSVISAVIAHPHEMRNQMRIPLTGQSGFVEEPIGWALPYSHRINPSAWSRRSEAVLSRSEVVCPCGFSLPLGPMVCFVRVKRPDVKNGWRSGLGRGTHRNRKILAFLPTWWRLCLPRAFWQEIRGLFRGQENHLVM